MAKKKNDDPTGLIIGIFLIGASLISGSLLLINTFMVRNHFAKKYDLAKVETRVSPTTWQILKNFFSGIAGMGMSFLASLFFFFMAFAGIINFQRLTAAQQLGYIGIGGILGLFFLIVALGLSARLATRQIGMLVLPSEGIFIIPADTSKNTFNENLLQGRYFTDMFKMEELPLKDVTKITKEAGKKLYVHGKFGTRCIPWGDKQKRDECVNALEMACKRRLGSFEIES